MAGLIRHSYDRSSKCQADQAVELPGRHAVEIDYSLPARRVIRLVQRLIDAYSKSQAAL